MLLHLTDLSPEPLHEQISRQIRAQILSGQLEDGSPLLSIRALARQEKVSVITVQRAYDDLLREGLLVARRGKGFFVAPIPEQQKRDLALARIRRKLQAVVQEARAEGLGSDMIRQAFQQTVEGE
jgi:GntR family transcriptional regulator